MYPCLPYSAVILIGTALWTYFGNMMALSLDMLTNCMFFPALLSVFYAPGLWDYLLQVIGYNKIGASFLYAFVGIVLVYVVVYGCVFLDLLLGWAEPVPDEQKPEHEEFSLHGFLRAAGEEIGWRCYLLPCLLQHYSAATALLISGTVWAVFHVPIMILLMSLLKPPRPITTIVVQSATCIVGGFAFGWLAIKSGFSMWPPAVMHAVWNTLNPKVLGSIYAQSPGEFKGEQWKINGEGLAGCLVYLPICALVIYDLR